MTAELDSLRESITQALKNADYEGAGVAISKAVPALLQLSVDEWVEDEDNETAGEGCDATNRQSRIATSANADSARKANDAVESDGAPEESPSDSSSSGDEGSSSDSEDDSEDGGPPISSYRYRSMIHLPRNPRLEHLCTWLYDTVVHPDSEEEPEEQACQKLPAAILAAWRRLQQQQQQKQSPQQLQQQSAQDAKPGSDSSGAGAAAAAAVSGSALPPTEALHLQHSAFSAPYCTWRPVAPDALPPLHDVLVGVLRVCWDRHDDREPSRNIIWGAQSHSRRDDPVTAYLYVEYLRLLLVSIIKSRAEPLWLWHELQEVIEEYPHWRHHPHEVAVLARMMAENGCGIRLLNSVLDHIGKAPLLMYGAWAALWDGVRRNEARACCRLASHQGVPLEAVWVHVSELTLLQVKEHPRDPKLLARAEAVLSRCLALTPAPVQLAALLRAERDAPGSCQGVRHVTSQLRLDELLAKAQAEEDA